MTISRFKRLCLGSLIGFLSLSALIAVVSLLSGDFGSTQIKVALTTLTISGASICAMSCSAFIEKRGLPYLGSMGIGCVLIAATLAILGMWSEFDNNNYWKTTITLIILSAAFAHCFLLFLPTLTSNYRWSQIALALCVSILAFQIAFAVWGEIHDIDYYRLMGVIAVIVVLLTLVVPICSRLAPAKLEAANLTLSHEEGDIYYDSTGQRYRVTKIEIEQSDALNTHPSVF